MPAGGRSSSFPSVGRDWRFVPDQMLAGVLDATRVPTRPANYATKQVNWGTGLRLSQIHGCRSGWRVGPRLTSAEGARRYCIVFLPRSEKARVMRQRRNAGAYAASRPLGRGTIRRSETVRRDLLVDLGCSDAFAASAGTTAAALAGNEVGGVLSGHRHAGDDRNRTADPHCAAQALIVLAPAAIASKLPADPS